MQKIKYVVKENNKVKYTVEKFSKLKYLFEKYREVIMYLVFGVLTTVVSLVTYYLLTLTILNAENALQLQIANVISWIVSVTFAYITNRKYVFDNKSKNILKEVSSFVGGRVVTLLLDMLIMFIFVTVLHFNDKLFKLVSQFLVIVLNYVISKLFVFKESK